MYKGYTQETYSRCGSTMVLFAASRTPVCLVLVFPLIKPNDLLASEQILFIYFGGQVYTNVPS